MSNSRFFRSIALSLFCLGTLGAVGLDLQFNRHHPNRFGIPSEANEVENVAAKRYWDYLRLRDPATGEIPRGIHSRELAFARTIGAHSDAMKLAPTIQTTQWNSAGPNNAGGRTQAIGIDIANESNVLIATAQGGIFRSTNSGQDWRRTTAPDALKDLMCLVQDHRTGKTATWYCGTGELLSTTDRRASVNGAPRWRTTDIGNGIYKSVDNGLSWSLLPTTHDATETTLDSAFDGVWNIVVDNSKVNQDVVYAAGYGAIMRSADGGATWNRVLGDPSHKSFCTDIQITSTGVLYAYLSQSVLGDLTSPTAGVWRSADGINWTNITPSGWPSQTQRLKIAIAPSNENMVYVGGSDDGAGLNPILFLYKYLSGTGAGTGGTWEDRSSNLPNVSDGEVAGASSLGGYAVVLRVYPTDPDIVFYGGTNLFRSLDGFASSGQQDWISGYNPDPNGPQSYPNQHPDNHDLVFSPANPRHVLSSNDGGIYGTDDILANDFNNPDAPVTWQILNNNDVASIIFVVAVDHGTPNDSTVVGGFQDQGSWIGQEGQPWTQIGGGDGCYCAMADHKEAYYVSSQFGYISQYIEATQSWSTISGSGSLPDPQFVTPWMLDPVSNNTMYLSGGSQLMTCRNLDAGDNAQMSTLSNCSVPQGTSITALGMSQIPAHRLYYGTSDGHLFRLDNANLGSSKPPTEITGSNFPKDAFISCIAVDPNNADSIVVCFSNYHVVSLFSSNDGGLEWRNVSGNLEQHPDGSGDGPSTRWVSIVRKNGQTLYLVGTSVGLFSTPDISATNGVTWIPEGLQTIGRALVENIDVRQSDGFVAIATQGSGIYTSNVIAPPQNAVASTPSAATMLTLSPNPASDRARISVTAATASHIRVVASDLTGKQLSVIYDGNASQGLFNYSFDCSRLPIGSYYVEVRAGDAVETKRLVVKR